MASGVTYEGDIQRAEMLPDGGLFEGRKLWFSRGVPSRDWLIQNAQKNGAQIVQLEQQADIKLVDHARKNQAPGTHSYRYVELSIRNGQLEDLDAHRVGSTSRVERPVGSVVTAPKGTRSKFTNAEDQLLWNWMKPYVDAGGAWKGNDIYKQLEAAHPNHTFQSWRDRWIKHTQFQNREVTIRERQNHVELYEQVEDNLRSVKRRKIDNQGHTLSQQANTSAAQTRRGPATSETAQIRNMSSIESSQNEIEDIVQTIQDQDMIQRANLENNVINHDFGHLESNEQRVEPVEAKHERTGDHERPSAIGDEESGVSADVYRLPLAYNFTQEEARMLYKATCHILNTRVDRLDESWSGVAEEYGHSEEAWRRFFYDVIVPEYMKRNGIRDDAELEIHYKMQVREQRERAARELALKQQDFNPPPRPNESRKLSSSRGSQSLSSQSRSQPSLTSTSQPLQSSSASRLHTRVSEFVEHEIPHQSQMVQAITSEPQSTGTKQRTKDLHSQIESKQEPATQLGSAHELPVTQESGESNELSGRFVTQISRNEEVTSSQNSSSLEDIPHRRLIPVQSRLSGESFPLLFEQTHGSSPRSSHDQNHKERPGLSSSPPLVQLVESDDFVSESDRYSTIASSEAPSEGVYFESQAELSQGWETAPVTTLPEVIVHDTDADVDNNDSQDVMKQSHDTFISDKPLDDLEDDDDIIVAVNRNTATGGQTSNDQPESDPQTAQSTLNDFETAPVKMLGTDPVQDDGEIEPEVSIRKNTNHRLETQALFQQPIRQDLAELVTIPEPPGGWDEEGLEERPTEFEDTEMEISCADADWTMPLPNPDLAPDEVPPSSKEDDSAGVDNWLASQPQTYTTVPSILLRPLSHRALESASMNLELATIIIAYMVQRYEKGKNLAHPTVRELRKLRKPQQKSEISKIVEELVPRNQRGCWTREDDEALLGVNGREIKRVGDKHGEEEVKNRFEFLEMWHSN